MITLNLLPKEYRKKKKKKKVKKESKYFKNFAVATWAYVGGAVAGVIIVGVFLAILFIPKASLQSKLNQIKRQEGLIQKGVKYAKKLDSRENKLKAIVGGLEDFKSRSIQWSPLLNDISDATPEDLQLTSLFVQMEKQKVEPRKKRKPKKKSRRGRKAKAKKPSKPKVQMVKKYLILEGVLAEDKSEAVLNRFLENLRAAPFFSKIFKEVMLSSIMTRQEGIKQFRVTCVAEVPK